MLVDALLAHWPAAAISFLAGMLFGGIGLGSFACALTGAAFDLPVLDAFIVGKAWIAAMDLAAVARFATGTAGSVAARRWGPPAAVGGALGAAATITVGWFGAAITLVLTLSAVFVAHARHRPLNRSLALAAGSYVGAFGVASGSLSLAWLRRSGCSWLESMAFARVLGAAANVAAVTLYAICRPHTFAALTPWMLFPVLGAYSGVAVLQKALRTRGPLVRA